MIKDTGDTAPKNPILSANCFSRLLFTWMNKFFREGNKRDLVIGDLCQVLPNEHSESLGNQLGGLWNAEITKSLESAKTETKHGGISYEPSLRKAIARQFLGKFMLMGILAFIEECVIGIVQPLFLGFLIRYFSGSEFSDLYGWLFASGLAGSAFLFVLTHHPFFFGVQRLGSQVRIACCSLIYRKALRLSQSALGQTTIGQMVNLLSNDVNRFDQSTIFLHYLWIAPIQTVIATFILWQFFGPSCLVGVVLLLLFVPFQGYMGKYFSKLRVKTAGRTDSRIRVMNEFLNGIRVIKMYAWEIPFSALVANSREEEVKVIRQTNHLRAINMGIFFISSKIIIFCTLLVYVANGNVLTAEKVFVTLCLFNNIRITVTLFMPSAVSQMAEALVSIKRLQTFLLLEERSKLDIPPPEIGRRTMNRGELTLENVTAKWSTSNKEDTLSHVNLNVAAGQLIAVIGHVGSGKTSLLHTILSELPTTEGYVQVNGTLGYAAQEPWIFPASVRENILFGKVLDPDWYESVLAACALKHDLTLFPFGDQTLLGDKGISLSGGQRARVALCRAVYANADIYLLDDPLSAVDSEVGKHIFEKCINGLLRDKTRILVTHQLQFLKYANRIVLMENGGKIQMEVTYEQLLESGIDLAKLLQNPLSTENTAEEVDNENENLTPLKTTTALRSRRKRTMSEGSGSSRYSICRVESIALGENTLLGQMCSHENICVLSDNEDLPGIESKESETSMVTAVDSNQNGGETIQFLPKVVDESKSSGKVPLSIYWKYFRSGSNSCVLFLLFATSILTQLLFTGCDYWLNIWTKAEEMRVITFFSDVDNILESDGSSNLTLNTVNTTIINPTAASSEATSIILEWNRENYVLLYSLIVIIFSIFAMIRSLLFFKVCMDASVGLHNGSFRGIMRAPMRFFEINPLGMTFLAITLIDNLLGRVCGSSVFSKDLGCIDDALPICFFDASVIFLNVIGIMVLIGCVNPVLLLPGIILAGIFFYLRTYYLNMARSVKRLEGIVRSPVFSHLNSSLHGLTTIRAYGVESDYIRQFDKHQDLHSSAWFLFIASTRWFGIRLDLLSVLFISIVTFSFMVTSEGGSGPEVGLAISSVLVLSGMFQWGVRQSAEVSNQMISVERILDYTTLPSEAPLQSTIDKKPPEDWPSKGEIELTNVIIRYGDDPKPVLNNLSLLIRSREKVGIVGRTGAGKSSILSALFRIIEPTGKINIDGCNILEIGLHDLRSKISIIPQDPVLFTGSVRKNLDPFQEFSDIEIWSVLKKVHLSESFELPGGLESEIAESGGNLSLGERQLMCLGRAILRKNRILVLDEATASVDPETDALIQETIREMFNDCTVLTIAHRLNTVMDSDRILVLDSGMVKEFDEPYVLLQNQRSALYNLVKETGNASMEQLIRISKEAFQRRNHPECPNETTEHDRINRKSILDLCV